MQRVDFYEIQKGDVIRWTGWNNGTEEGLWEKGIIFEKFDEYNRYKFYDKKGSIYYIKIFDIYHNEWQRMPDECENMNNFVNDFYYDNKSFTDTVLLNQFAVKKLIRVLREKGVL